MVRNIIEMRGGVMDTGRTNNRIVNIELLSQWKLEAEFRKNDKILESSIVDHQRLHLWFKINSKNLAIDEWRTTGLDAREAMWKVQIPQRDDLN